jgi:hypothetical protein
MRAQLLMLVYRAKTETVAVNTLAGFRYRVNSKSVPAQFCSDLEKRMPAVTNRGEYVHPESIRKGEQMQL